VIATASGFTMLEIVLQADADVDDLIDAITRDDCRKVYGLLMQGVEVNYLAGPGGLLTPLIVAAKSGHSEAVKHLLDSKTVHLNMCNSVGETALIACTKAFAERPGRSHLEVAALLLRAGCNRYLRDDAGQSCADILQTMKRIEKQADSASSSNGTGNSSIKHRSSKSGSSNPFGESEVSEGAASPDSKADTTSAVNVTTIPTPKRWSTMPDFPRIPSPPLDHAHSYEAEYAALLAHDPAKAEIFEVAKTRNLIGVKALLYQGVDANRACPVKRYTPLIAAVYNR
jgi:hypothetical protein